MGLRIALTGIQAGLDRLANIANNVANVRTPGFRSRRTEQASLPNGAGVTTTTALRTQPGSPESTGDPLTVALQGDALLVLRDGNGGQSFTRAGIFGLNGRGELTTPDGRLVEPGIQIPTGTTGLRIGRDGTVVGTPPGATQPQVFGQLQVARFTNPAGLQATGANAFRATAASGAPQLGTLSGTATDAAFGGFIESSNVDLARELTNELLALRSVQANVGVARRQNDALGTLLDLIQ